MVRVGERNGREREVMHNNNTCAKLLSDLKTQKLKHKKTNIMV
jgi:hypothetical protein